MRASHSTHLEVLSCADETESNPVAIDAASLEIMWNRLQAIADEADAVLARTAFSSVVREAHDYVTVLMDPDGRALIQSTYSIPSFVGTMPMTAKHVLAKYPLETMRPGDVFVTNDPWLGTGHLFDMCMVSPIFAGDRIVGLAGNVAHMTDIGGGGMSAQAATIHEEGLCLPPIRLFDAGNPNPVVTEIIAANVRVPQQVLGDLEAEAAANRTMAQRTVEFLSEYGLADLDGLATEIFSRSERAVRDAIKKVPNGVYRYDLDADGFDTVLQVRLAATVADDAVVVDYEGSSPQVPRGINSVMNYTTAYTNYGLKCIFDPYLSNNDGSLRAFTVRAPRGSFLNAVRPAAVASRHTAGHLLPTALLGAFADVLPGRAMAGTGGSPLWTVSLNGIDANGIPFSTVAFFAGGQGGRSSGDGHATLHFPTNAASTPVELLELQSPVLVEEKRIWEGSGGDGRSRGGDGQIVAIRILGENPVSVSLTSGQTGHAARGVFSGDHGRLGRVIVEPPRDFNPGGNLVLNPGDLLRLEVPGGGGFGSVIGETRTKPSEII